ncbi:YheC/YheD family protein [Brevibacillus laterosporus]|nr:YheC/YheD family protein [Brevibacillus laterosporus]TPG82088.1 YheC/YheD family protein [Brevibacillus laterosporus]
MANRKLIGILTWREGTKFSEPKYFRNLIRQGKELGVKVFLFSHRDVLVKQRRVRGYIPDKQGGWSSKWFGWPDVVIDRCRTRQPGYLSFRRQKHFLYANSVFSNKWNITDYLWKDETMRKWMPRTQIYSEKALHAYMEDFPIVYVKPGNGTGGRSVLKISRVKGGFLLVGRNKNVQHKTWQVTSRDALVERVNLWVDQEQIRKGYFMVQQGLDLALLPDRPSDTRLLIQKNQQGKWSITGLGVRVGVLKSATSNLHNGGKATDFISFMNNKFGEERGKEILNECHELAYYTVKKLEEKYGRMLEFGLDIGIDTSGHIWLIEVNPKPGRDIFLGMGKAELYKEAVRNPLAYAIWLAETENKTVARYDK